MLKENGRMNMHYIDDDELNYYYQCYLYMTYTISPSLIESGDGDFT